MLGPDELRVNESEPRTQGWLLLLVVLLVFWHPFTFARTASTAIYAIDRRGSMLGVLIVVRLLVTAVGFAAGLALLRRRPGAVTMALAALALSAAMDLIVYLTPYFPNNRYPGETPLYVAWSVFYHSAWSVFLLRSKQTEGLR